MLAPVLESLDIRPELRVLDATLGLGGHAEAILSQIGPRGQLLGLEWDASNLAHAQERLSALPNASCATLVHQSFAHLKKTAEQHGFLGKQDGGFDAILFDLGLSSVHLDSPERGFSFRFDSALDMRMGNETARETAAQWVLRVSVAELATLLAEHGERRAQHLAEVICRQRPQTTFQLLSCVEQVYKMGIPQAAARVFSAIRIWVNDEYNQLRQGLHGAISALRAGGVLGVITFHSGEDRLVKHLFRQVASEQPNTFQRREHRGQTPTAQEIAENPRARSARLRLLARTKP